MDSMLLKLIDDSLLAGPLLGWVVLGFLLVFMRLTSARREIFLGTTLVGLVALLVYSIYSMGSAPSTPLFMATCLWDSLSQMVNIISILICLAVTLMTTAGNDNDSKVYRDAYEHIPEFLICMIFSGFGVGVLASAIDLSALFLGLEILSIGIYCMTGFFRTDLKSTEAALKYLLIGAFSTVIFLYGVAFIYGATGATQYQAIQAAIGSANPTLLLFGILFLIAGLGFKLAFVPFHLYTADVYEGAPTPVTAYMATIIKVGAAVAALRIFWGFLGTQVEVWGPFWLGLCVLSILLGNLVALQQRTIKRLLAFSSISHAGFIGLGVYIAGTQAQETFALMSYLVVYSAMSLGSFAMVNYFEDRSRPFLVEDLKGLGQTKLVPCLCLGVFLLGLAGIPPFAGFMIKFWIFQGLIESGNFMPAILAVIGSVIGAAYYLRLLIFMFVSPERGAANFWTGSHDRFFSLRFLVLVTLLVTLLGSIRPQIYADWILASLALK